MRFGLRRCGVATAKAAFTVVVLLLLEHSSKATVISDDSLAASPTDLPRPHAAEELASSASTLGVSENDANYVRGSIQEADGDKGAHPFVQTLHRSAKDSSDDLGNGEAEDGANPGEDEGSADQEGDAEPPFQFPEVTLNAPSEAQSCEAISLTAEVNIGLTEGPPLLPSSYRWSLVSPVTVVLRQFFQKQTEATVEIPTDIVYATANALLARNPTLQTQKITFSVVAVYENGESEPGEAVTSLTLRLPPPVITPLTETAFTVQKDEAITLKIRTDYCPHVKSDDSSGIQIDWSVLNNGESMPYTELLKLEDDYHTAVVRNSALKASKTYTITASVAYTEDTVVNTKQDFVIKVINDFLFVRLQVVSSTKDEESTY